MPTVAEFIKEREKASKAAPVEGQVAAPSVSAFLKERAATAPASVSAFLKQRDKAAPAPAAAPTPQAAPSAAPVVQPQPVPEYGKVAGLGRVEYPAPGLLDIRTGKTAPDVMAGPEEPEKRVWDPWHESVVSRRVADVVRNIYASTRVGGEGRIGAVEQLGREEKTKMLPFLGSLYSALNMSNIKAAAERLAVPEESYDRSKMSYADWHAAGFPATDLMPGEAKALDRAVVETFLLQQAEVERRGQTIPAQAVSGIMRLVPYMLEFYLTAGLANAASGSVKAAVQALATKYAANLSPKVVSLATGLAGITAGAAARTAALTPFSVLEQSIQRQLPRDATISPEGRLIVREAGDKPATAWMRAFGDVFIEMLSEESGKAIGAAGRALLNKIPGPAAQGLRNVASRLAAYAGRTRLGELATRAGYHGYLEEMGEERLGDLLRAVANIPPPGQTEAEKLAFFERIGQALFPGMEPLAVEAIVLAIPGATRVAAGAIVGKPAAPPPAEPAPAVPVPPEAPPAAPAVTEGRGLPPTPNVLETARMAERLAEVEGAEYQSPRVSEMKTLEVMAELKKRHSQDALKDGYERWKLTPQGQREGAGYQGEMKEAGQLETFARLLLSDSPSAVQAMAKEAPAAPPAAKVAPAVGAEPKVAPPTKPEALPKAVEAEPTPVREPLAPTEAERGPLIRAMPIAERQQLAERLELAASEAIGKDLEAQGLRDRFAQAVRESVPEAQQGTALAMADRIAGERSYLRALSRAEKLVVRTYGAGAEKMVPGRAALRGRLRGERIAANAAWRAASAQAREATRKAKVDVKAIRAELVNAVRDVLPVSERGKLITQIRAAETPKTLARALARVDKVVEQYGQRRARTHLVRLFKKAKKAKLRRQYKPVVAAILEGYNVSSPSDSVLANLAGMARYLAQHPDDHFLTNREVASLKKITARNIRDMTAEELDVVSDAITQILHANRTTNRILAGQQRRRIGDAAERLRTIQKQPLAGYAPQEMTPAERRGVFTRAAAWLKRTITPARYRASLADQQSRDPGQPGGPVAELVERAVTYGASDALGHTQGAADALRGAIRAEGMDPNSAEFVEQIRETPVAVRIPSSGKTVEMSIADLMSFYANTLDPENRRALVRDGWTPEYLFQRKGPKAKPVRRQVLRAQPIRLTAEDTLAIRDALPEPYRRIVEASQAHKNGPLRDAAWKSVQAVKGYAPESLPDQWHLRRNRAAQERRDAGELQRLWFQAALEDSGILKDRSPGARQPVITGDFFAEHSRQISVLGRVAGLTVPVRDARMFLGNPLTRSTLDAALGPEYIRTWNTWLQNVAGAGIQRPEAISGGIRLFTGKYMGAKLAGNVIVGAKTLGSLAPATHYVGGTYIAKAVAEGPLALREALDRAETYSPLIRDRYERSPREWLTPGFEMGRHVLGPSSWAEESMLPIRSGDRTVVGTTWRGAELRVEAENPGLKESDPAAYYEKVRRFAEDVVGWTQPFAGAAFQPPIGFAARQNPVIHWLFTMFKSQPIQNVTLALDETGRFARGPKNKAAYKRLMSAYIVLALQAAWYFMWTQFARQLYKPLRRKVLGEERAKREDKIATIFNALRATVGNVVFVDPFLDVAEAATRRSAKLYSAPLAETPIAEILTESARATAALLDAVDKAFDGEWEKSRDKTVEGTLRTARVISNVTGLPEVVPRYTKLLYDYLVPKKKKKGPVAPTRPVPPKPPAP